MSQKNQEDIMAEEMVKERKKIQIIKDQLHTEYKLQRDNGLISDDELNYWNVYRIKWSCLSVYEDLKNNYPSYKHYVDLCMQFSSYLNEVRLDSIDINLYSQDILTNMWALITPEKIEILKCIKLGDIEGIKNLHQQNYKITSYKNIQFELAVKYEHIDMIFYLLESRSYNLNYAGLKGLLRIVCSIGSVNLFEQIIKKYKSKILNDVYKGHVVKNNYTIYDYYQQQNIVEFEDILYDSLRDKNDKFIEYIIKNSEIMKLVDYDNIISKANYYEGSEKENIIKWCDEQNYILVF